jgi:hypothetical protein
MAQAQLTDHNPHQSAAHGPDPVAEAMAESRAALRSAQNTVAQEIRAYPMPISGCDAQFNHLLALRQQIAAALVALDSPAWIPTSRHPD